ncbi:MAG: substrate-binding domain-containing protein [Bacteroidales bacterium]|jgi:ribose transport system substrate-binding protein|nr:substrate-binding domain-containing protein [Bacteroidales bacterium]
MIKMKAPQTKQFVVIRRRRYLIFLYISIFALSLMACNSKQGTEKQKRSTIDSTAEVNKSDLTNIKIGYCTPSHNAPFYVVLTQYIQKYTEGYGMKFLSADGQDDIIKQITSLEDLIAAGVDVLILNPLDHKALVPAVNAAVKSGVPVFIVDSAIDPTANYITSVQANNEGNGELIGEWIVNKMGRTKIKAALISGSQGNPVGKEKRLGFVRGFAETQMMTQGKADLTIVSQGWGNWTNNGGLKAMEDILVAYPDINLLVAENDAMGMGALKAINESGKADNILVAGFDGQKEAYELIKEGKFGVTALNSPGELARLVVEAVVKYLNGERQIDKIIYTDAVIITKNNVDKYYDPKAIF